VSLTIERGELFIRRLLELNRVCREMPLPALPKLTKPVNLLLQTFGDANDLVGVTGIKRIVGFAVSLVVGHP
jgi:hypothetical protein